MRTTILLLSLALLLPGQATDPGLKVGSTIPAFRLADQNGQEQTLQSITGPKGAVLVFYRSADW